MGKLIYDKKRGHDYDKETGDTAHLMVPLKKPPRRGESSLEAYLRENPMSKATKHLKKK